MRLVCETRPADPSAFLLRSEGSENGFNLQVSQKWLKFGHGGPYLSGRDAIPTAALRLGVA